MMLKTIFVALWLVVTAWPTNKNITVTRHSPSSFWANVPTDNLPDFLSEDKSVEPPVTHQKRFMSRSLEWQAIYHFTCPRMEGQRRRRFTWTVRYDGLTSEVKYDKGENTEYFTKESDSGWDPISYHAIWHHRICVLVDPDTSCYYHFWGYFYGEVWPNHITVIAPTQARGTDVSPGLEEACVPKGTLPGPYTPWSTCTIGTIYTGPAHGPGSI